MESKYSSIARDPVEIVSSAPIIAGPANEYTKANVFGIFFTLGISLIVQPYGNLLFTRPANTAGHALFFFIRLHPLACCVEAFVLVGTFLRSGLGALKSRHDTDRVPLSLWDQFRITATAVYIIRGHQKVPWHWSSTEGRERNDGNNAVATMTSSGIEILNPPLPPRVYLPNERQPHMLNQSVSSWNIYGCSRGLSTNPENHRCYICRILLYLGFYLEDGQSAYHSSEPTQSSLTDTAAVSTSRSSADDNVDVDASEIEEPSPLRTNDVGTLPSPVSSSNTRNEHFNAEIWINIFSTIAVLVTVMKLIVIQIPKYVRMSAWMMVSGWITVQLLYLASYKHLGEGERSKAVRKRALDLQLVQNSTALCAMSSIGLLLLFVFFSFPTLEVWAAPSASRLDVAYFAFCGCFYGLTIILITRANPVNKLIATVLSEGGLIHQIQTQLYTIAHMIGDKFLPKRVRHIVSWFLIPDGIQISVLFLAGVLTGCLYGFRLATYNLSVHGVAWGTILLPMAAWAIAPWTWFIVPTRVFSLRAIMRPRAAEIVKSICLFCNLVTLGFLLTGALLTYDATGSQKPDWLEWFG